MVIVRVTLPALLSTCGKAAATSDAITLDDPSNMLRPDKAYTCSGKLCVIAFGPFWPCANASVMIDTLSTLRDSSIVRMPFMNGGGPQIKYVRPV